MVDYVIIQFCSFSLDALLYSEQWNAAQRRACLMFSCTVDQFAVKIIIKLNINIAKLVRFIGGSVARYGEQAAGSCG